MRLPEETSPCISLLSLHSAGKAHILLFFGGTSRVQRRQWHPTSVFLPGKCPGRRSLVGCSPRGCGRVGHDWATSLLLSCIGEGNGNPLQRSCLENPRDGGVWWAAVYGVAQSRVGHDWSDLAAAAGVPQNVFLLLSNEHTSKTFREK